jgi:hypothetical protein
MAKHALLDDSQAEKLPSLLLPTSTEQAASGRFWHIGKSLKI